MEDSGHKSKKRSLGTQRTLSDSPSRLNDVGLLEFIESDPRPTFVLDISAPSNSAAAASRLVYSNSSLDDDSALLGQFQSLFSSIKEIDDCVSRTFRHWALEPASSDLTGSEGIYKSFLRYSWITVTIRDRWNLVSGFPIGPMNDDDFEHTTTTSSTNAKDLHRVAQTSDSQQEVGNVLDWTLPGSCFELTSHIEMVRSFDWGSTPLGPMKNWSEQFRLIINMLMADPCPAILFWGKELTTIYNEAYIPIFRHKHPWGLGRPHMEVFADVAVDLKDFYEPMWERGRKHGMATAATDERFVIALHCEFLEEVFCSYTTLPVLGCSGSVGGFYIGFQIVTDAVLATRRESILRAAFDANADEKDPEAFWRNLVDVISSDENDIVSVFAYSVRSLRRDASSPAGSHPAQNTVLQAFSAVPIDDRRVPCAHDLFQKNTQLMAVFDDALRTGMPQIYEIEEAALSRALVHPARPIDDQNIPRQLVLCSTDPKLSSQGFLVIAINPLRPYDMEFQRFVGNLAREISVSLAAADRARFAKQAVAESELRFSQMTATSSAAHFEVNLEGQILYVNERWHSMTGMPRPSREMPAMSWLQLIHEPDLPLIQGEWAKLQAGESVSFEVRMKKNWQAINPFGGETLKLEYTWVLAMASQHLTKSGPTIMGCLVDINRQKWAEDFHKRKTEEAIEMKHQQERFIDMTSHEMRNPLSAIFQCSDSIVSILEDVIRRYVVGDIDESSQSLKSCIEAARTISLCAQHQKRIVDDVLVLSKMDANLIEVTPVDSNPRQLLESGLSIFASELQANDTHMEFRVDDSYGKLTVEWVRLDPCRLLQILINLTTNALKFTMAETKERRIVVSLGASITPPSDLSPDDAGFTFLPRSGDVIDPTLRPDWGSGDPVYLHFSVKDTGRGISEVEMKELFMRFKQASPRTHVDYGGSGLGLHIARQLTEMHGGQIGVTSQRGKGSTFSFYIKARRCNPAEIPLKAPPATITTSCNLSGSPTASMSATQHSQYSQISTEATSTHLPQKLNILIVEDNVVNQKVLSKQLQNLGWNVSVANHGIEALDALKRTVFWTSHGSSKPGEPLDCVLMDIEMPIMDGLTATKEIRNLQADGTIQNHVPIIAVSANARAEQVARIKAAGVVRFHPSCAP
jgi:PAS domain S-box-containing protein